MYLASITIENFRGFGEGPKRFHLQLGRGLTALIGENDSGKTAIIDALRFVLGTRDQEWNPVSDTDFNDQATSHEITITCKFEQLDGTDKRAFLEYLTYEGEQPVLYLNWTAKDVGERGKRRGYRKTEIHSGKNGDGPLLAPEVREMLRTTYLRPLRDAQQELSAGRGSRLSQVLQHTDEILTTGVPYDPATPSVDPKALNVLGIGDLANALLANQKGIATARDKVNEHLKKLALSTEAVSSSISVSGATAPVDVRLRQLLEKLDLALNIPGQAGKAGLGSNNLLFIACELLLLAQEREGSKLLLIEEPEAHLHPQRQLRVMRFLQSQAEEKKIQVIVTTHSPNLASAIDLNNIVMIRGGRAFSMREGQTELQPSDYRFLQRFLDVTKANLFFARGVLIVEGDAENILVPTLASLLGQDFTEYGVSVVNVGGVGLSRYARIFQRKNASVDGQIGIPVSCVTDMDVMPDCAPVIIGRVAEGAQWPALALRRWRAKADFGTGNSLAELRAIKRAKASGQSVITFVSDEWTLEYDLALGPKQGDSFPGGLAKDVYVAACLAERDEDINSGKVTRDDVINPAVTAFSSMSASVATENCSAAEVVAANVYAKFAKGASKAVAAQYLAERLQNEFKSGALDRTTLRARLPKYLIDAIDHVTGMGAALEETAQ